MAGQKGIPKHMDQTEIKNNFCFPKKGIYGFGWVFLPFQKVDFIWFGFWCLDCFVLSK